MADKTISELVRAQQIFPEDLWLAEQGGIAKAVTGQVILNMLLLAADGHGGIKSWEIQPGPGPLEFKLILTLAKSGSKIVVPMQNGRGITGFRKTGSSGTVETGIVNTYEFTYNDNTRSPLSIKDGKKGDKGDATYLWIKFADENPSAPPHSMGDIPASWIGFYVGEKSSAPALWSDYKWYKIKGDKGDTGEPATLKSTTTEYQVGNSGTVAPSGEWLKEVPPTPQGRWLWTRTKYIFNSGDPVITYSVGYMGKDGKGTVNSVDGVTAGPNGDVKLGAWRSINDITPGEDGLGRLTSSDIGAVEIKKLWENASPSSQFSAQTVPVDAEGYQYLLITASYGTLTATAVSLLMPIGVDGMINITANNAAPFFSSGGTVVLSYRWVHTTSTTVKFSDGYSSNLSSGSLYGIENGRTMPLCIYGVKGVL